MATEEQLRAYLQRATDELTAARRRQAAAERRADRLVARAHEPIAIIGMACRYPGGVTAPEDLWRVVEEGADAIGDLPTDRGWDLAGLYDPDPAAFGSSYCRQGGFLYDAADFDPAVFGISPRAALAMDPQHRVFLETVWEVFERAGIDPTGLRGADVGVYAAGMFDHYGTRFLGAVPEAVEGTLLTSTLPAVLSGQVSYNFGLQGPAISVDTACSSSLVTLHLAVRALRAGECSLALAGGAAVMATPDTFVEFSRQQALAADGRSKPFSAAANGVAWSEGAGVLLLERLSDARAKGRHIWAVVRGSAINQDGRSNGLTAPSGPAQERVIAAALADAGLDPTDVDHVEAHGTGTTLGDPIEAAALVSAYGRHREAERPLWLGSLKGNLGHTQAAAGVAGVIKSVLALRHEVLPASRYADAPSPHVDWTAGVRLSDRPRPWPVSERPARAAVSGFGISGTNGHVVLERVEPPVAGAEPVPDLLTWPVSAQTPGALARQAGRLADWLDAAPDGQLAAASRLLAARAVLEHRAVVVAGDRRELAAALRALQHGAVHPALSVGTALADVRPVFVFPGQGSQWPGMAVDLLDTDPVFAAALERCALALAPYTGWSVIDVLRGAPGAPQLETSAVVQPTLFAVMVALAERWTALGVTPAAVLGQSQGELAAACVAGALDLSEAAAVVALRARALDGLRGTGAMLAVDLPADRAEAALAPWAGRLWVAVRSGVASCVVAGSAAAAEEFCAAPHGIPVRRVGVDYASHTPLVDPLRDVLARDLPAVHPRATETAFCSATTGDFLDPQRLDNAYWWDNLRRPVLFDTAVQAVLRWTRPIFVECSPHPMLAGELPELAAAAGVPAGVAATLRRRHGDRRQFLAAAAAGFVTGLPVDWSTVTGPLRPGDPAVPLPTYAFDRQRFWLDAPTGSGRGTPDGVRRTDHPLLAAVVDRADGGLLLTGRVDPQRLSWLGDHDVAGTVLFPGTGFLELALTGGELAGVPEVAELTLEHPLPVAADPVELRLEIDPPADPDLGPGERSLRIAARLDGAWVTCARGRLGPATVIAATIPAVPAHAAPVDVAAGYAALAERGYHYGPAFRRVGTAWTAGDELAAELLADDGLADARDYALHPAALDAALHCVLLPGAAQATGLVVPFEFAGVRRSGSGSGGTRVRVTGSGTELSVQVGDATGRPVLQIDRVRVRELTVAPTGPPAYVVGWVPVPPAGAPPATVRPAFLPALGAGDDAAAVLAGLLGGPTPTRVVYDAVPATTGEALPAAVRTALDGLRRLLQAWLGEPRLAAATLVVLTHGAGPDGTDPVAGAVGGLLRGAQAEHPGSFVLADVPAGFTDWARLDAGEPVLAVRGDTLLAPRLTRHRATPGADNALPDPTTSPYGTGTVLITGGTGGLGALVAEHLAREHRVGGLLLVSRRGPDAPGAAALLTRLRALGVPATAIAADVADRDQLAQVLASVPADRPLSAVVHAAGVLADAAVHRLTAGDLDRVLGPKLDAAVALDEATCTLPLAAFVLFSSAAGVLGTPGQANYAAANAGLDALAAARRSAGLPAVSVAWGLWATRTGLTADLDHTALDRLGVAALSDADGLALLDTAVTAQQSLVVAARLDLAGLRAAERPVPALLRTLVGVPVAAPTSGGDLAARVSAAAPEEGRALLVDVVRRHVAAVLAHPDPNAVDVDRTFNALGFASLSAVELRNRLNAETGLRLPATVAFDFPTVAAVADYLAGELRPPAVDPEAELRAVILELTARAGTDPGARDRLAAVLHDGLRGLDRAGDLDAPERFATDDEIFAFIDGQL